MTHYATQVHARVTDISTQAGELCAELAAIDPADMQVSLVMDFCDRMGVDYAEVFSTRAAAV